MLRITSLSLVEPGRDDGGNVVGDRGGQPLAAGLRPRCPGAGGRAGPGDDVSRGAGGGSAVVDGGELGHPLAAVLLSGGQAGGQLAAGRRPGGGFPQRFGPHHNALAVELQHQQRLVISRGRRAPGVERVYVRRGAAGELLGLPLAEPHPGGPLDGRGHAVERAAGRLQRGQLPQPVRMLLLRQVQPLIGRVHVRQPPCPVGHPGHRDLAEHRHQRAGMILLRARPRLALRAGDVLAALLARRLQVQAVLAQDPLQLPALFGQALLQLRVRQPGRPRPGQPLHDLLKHALDWANSPSPAVPAYCGIGLLPFVWPW